MNILFLFCSISNLESDSGLYASLIHEFRRQGHNVFLSAKGKGITKTGLVEENGIPVIRILSQDFTGVKSNINKALGYIEYSIKQVHFTKKFFKDQRFDLIISHSLPPEVGYITKKLKKRFKCPLYLIQSDFTWQDAVAFGYFSKNGPIGSYYRFWEKKMFKEADYIAVPTSKNISFIKNLYPNTPDEKFILQPLWQKQLEIEPDYQLKNEFGLNNKFVVLYGGSVGAAQRVDHIIELAETCKDYKDIVFVILGKGSYLSVLQQMVKDKGLKNVEFKQFLPQEQYLRFLASCDVGLIILNEKMATPNFPSKSLSYLNMKVPILAALDHVTDFGTYLEQNEAGLWGYSDDIPALKEKLLLYYHSEELRNKVKENGYMLFVKNMTPISAYQTILNALK